MPSRKSCYISIDDNIKTIIIVTLHLGSVINQNSQRCGDERRPVRMSVSLRPSSAHMLLNHFTNLLWVTDAPALGYRKMVLFPR